MQTRLITPDNALRLIEVFLQLPAQAFRPPFRKHRPVYQAELLQSFKHYQVACHIRLPGGRPALQTQQHRLDTLVRKMNAWASCLTEEALYPLGQQAKRPTWAPIKA